MQPRVFVDLRRVMTPVNRFIHVADNKLLELLVIGRKLNEVAEMIPAVRE